MRRLFICLIATLVASAPVRGQTPPAPPAKLTIAMRLATDELMRRDSADIATAVKSTIQADTLFEFVDRTPVPGEVLRGIRFVLSVTFVEAGGRLLTTLRVFDAQRGAVAAQESLSSSRGDLVKQLPDVVRKTLTPLKPS